MANISVKGVKLKIDKNNPKELGKNVELRLITKNTSNGFSWEYQFFPKEEGMRWSDINSIYYGCGVMVEFKFNEQWYTYTCESDDPNTFSAHDCDPKLRQDITVASQVKEVCIYRRTNICSRLPWKK